MKRVCILTSGHSPYDDRIFYKEAKSLKKAGLDVRVICSTGRYDELKEGIKVEGFKVDPFLTRILIGKLLKLINFVKLSVGAGCDIYHCHEFGSLMGAHLAKFIGKFIHGCKAPIIYDIHEWFPWDFSRELSYSFIGRILIGVHHRLHSFLCSRTDYIIVVTEELKLSLKNILVHSKIITIENFPPLELFTCTTRQSQRETFTVAYSGGLSRERGIYDLARAMQIFSQSSRSKPHLLLIGDFYSFEERESFLRFFQNADYLLQITGWIPHPQVPLLLSSADVCVIPLRRTARFAHSLPVKLFEYMALSKPVIATDFGPMKKVVEETHCGTLVNPSNPKAMAEAINFYYTHPDKIYRHGRNGRYWVEKRFNWGESEKKLLSIYSNLI